MRALLVVLASTLACGDDSSADGGTDGGIDAFGDAFDAAIDAREMLSALASATPYAELDETIRLDGSGSTGADTYEWNLGDGRALGPSPEPRTRATRGARSGARRRMIAAACAGRPLDCPAIGQYPRLSGPKESGSKSPNVTVRRNPSGPQICTDVSAPANSRNRWRQPPHGLHSRPSSSAPPTTSTSVMRVAPLATIVPMAQASAHCPWG